LSHYTYLHRRADDGIPFYIGKGQGARAHSHSPRNEFWKSIVRKHGISVEILAHWADEKDAFHHEVALIAAFRSMGFRLANLTDGGDGASGPRQKKVARRLGMRLSEATKAKLREINTGRRATDETRQKMRAAMMGKPKPTEAVEKQLKNSPQVRAVRCLGTGCEFISCGRAAVALGKKAQFGAHIAKAARLGLVAFGQRWEFI
jgi:hypothetical protein